MTGFYDDDRKFNFPTVSNSAWWWRPGKTPEGFLFNECDDDGDEDSEMMDKVNKV